MLLYVVESLLKAFNLHCVEAWNLCPVDYLKVNKKGVCTVFGCTHTISTKNNLRFFRFLLQSSNSLCSMVRAFSITGNTKFFLSFEYVSWQIDLRFMLLQNRSNFEKWIPLMNIGPVGRFPAPLVPLSVGWDYCHQNLQPFIHVNSCLSRDLSLYNSFVSSIVINEPHCKQYVSIFFNWLPLFHGCHLRLMYAENFEKTPKMLCVVNRVFPWYSSQILYQKETNPVIDSQPHVDFPVACHLTDGPFV